MSVNSQKIQTFIAENQEIIKKINKIIGKMEKSSTFAPLLEKIKPQVMFI
ncbi:MAG: hypothetical protein LBG92_02585 [Prevotellaceae bacterium]|jgi:uncharacterized protein YjgD (DUF1641 family)|nr:hypothetical protein [Prevotellaceae bacterium]